MKKKKSNSYYKIHEQGFKNGRLKGIETIYISNKPQILSCTLTIEALQNVSAWASRHTNMDHFKC